MTSTRHRRHGVALTAERGGVVMLVALVALVAFVISASLACVGTPQPDPPNVLVDDDQLFVDTTNNYSVIKLRGRAGAVIPAVCSGTPMMTSAGV